jgi:hypothetical protein
MDAADVPFKFSLCPKKNWTKEDEGRRWEKLKIVSLSSNVTRNVKFMNL